MQEPDFCEAQLQQMTNTELFNCLRTQLHLPTVPRVIPQYWEERWGWDTGLYIPWLGLPHTEQMGCNFFIQYKLSSQYTVTAIGGNSWRRPFLRFNLGYQRHSDWDFSQRDHLIMLADKGFVVVYITNHVLSFAKLAELAFENNLCSTLPVLRVNYNLSTHKRISFTPESTFFRLHSKEENPPKTSIAEILKSGKMTNLTDDLENIFQVLMHYEETVGIKVRTVSHALKDLQTINVKYAKMWITWRFLWHYLNIVWIRTPDMNEGA